MVRLSLPPIFRRTSALSLSLSPEAFPFTLCSLSPCCIKQLRQLRPPIPLLLSLLPRLRQHLSFPPHTLRRFPTPTYLLSSFNLSNPRLRPSELCDDVYGAVHGGRSPRLFRLISASLS